MIQPLVNEPPSEFADRLGLDYTRKVTPQHKKALGQFFTPRNVAIFIAEQARVQKRKIRILDPGSGVGILSCAVIEHLVSRENVVKEIELVAFETDIELIPWAEEALNYLRKWLQKKRIFFNYILAKNDFILHNSKILSDRTEEYELFDIVITNPPYFKIGKDDERAKAARSIIHGQSNIYSIFLLISAKLLTAEGQLIFITPRSFASGRYFRLFRERFFLLINISFIHLFESRNATFKRDKVLQENIIISGFRKPHKADNQLSIQFGTEDTILVTVSVSNGISDIAKARRFSYSLQELIDLKSKEKILHIPTSLIETRVINLFKSWKNDLSSYGIDVSTGPVVAHRSRENIASRPGNLHLPLIWLHNVSKMQLNWPIDNPDKGQYLIYNRNAHSKAIENKNYVLLRRFSTKDDQSRLIASPYLSKWFPDKKHVGIENHLNYIYRYLGELNETEVWGLSGLLNSTLFDTYFQTFNGNTNVSVTELKEMRFPSYETIEKLGLILKKKKAEELTQEFLDRTVRRLLNIQIS